MTELDSLNKFLTEKVFGEKYHRLEDIDADFFRCSCGDPSGYWKYDNYKKNHANPDFTAPDNWWKLWLLASSRDDWGEFLIDQYEYYFDLDSPIHSWVNKLIDLQAFPKAYARFKGWKGE